MLPTNDDRRRPQHRDLLNCHLSFAFLTSTRVNTIALTVNNMFVAGMVIVMHVSPNDTMLLNNCALAFMTLTELTDITLLKDAELFQTASRPNAYRKRSGKLAEASGWGMWCDTVYCVLISTTFRIPSFRMIELSNTNPHISRKSRNWFQLATL